MNKKNWSIGQMQEVFEWKHSLFVYCYAGILRFFFVGIRFSSFVRFERNIRKIVAETMPTMEQKR